MFLAWKFAPLQSTILRSIKRTSRSSAADRYISRICDVSWNWYLANSKKRGKIRLDRYRRTGRELGDLLDSNPESSDSTILPSTSARCIPQHIAAHHSARRTVVHYIASRTNSHRSTLRTSRAKPGIIRRADCAIVQFGISCLDHFRLLDRGLYDPICTPAVNLFRILSFCDPATRSRPQHRDSRNIS